MSQILVVEDDELLAASLRRALTYEGHEVTTAGDGLSAIEQVKTNPPDLMVLDLMLPVMDGIEVCRRVRQQSDLPILMLTARDGVADRVHGLDSGADDYLVKPFANEELAARIRTLLRRRQPPGATTLVCSDLVVDVEAHTAMRSDRTIDLTAQEFRLLEHLLRHQGHVLTRIQLLESVWDLGADTSSNVVDVYVSYLRHKLEAGGEPRLLHTVRGVGYVLRPPPGVG
ncbi:MAG TPA: response regulator transcription factor [Acidimicrobiia bacterium]|jgi:two-component system response regulator MprA